MDRQLAFALPQQVFGRNVPDTFSDEDDEKFQQRIRAKLDANVYADAEVGHIFSLDNGGSRCRENVFMQERQWHNLLFCDELKVAYVGWQKAQTAWRLAQRTPKFYEGCWKTWTFDQIRNKGVEDFKKMGLWVREGGGFDQRSPAIQDGRVQILPSGMPIGVHDCMRNLVDESPNHDVFGEIDLGDDDYPYIIAAPAQQRPQLLAELQLSSPANYQRLSVEHPELFANGREVTTRRRPGVEVARIEEGFHRLSVRGELRPAEFRAGFLNSGAGDPVPDALAEEWSALFQCFDSDSTGTLTVQQFICGVAILCRGRPDQKLRLLFMVYDADRDQRLSDRDLQKFAKSLSDGRCHDSAEAAVAAALKELLDGSPAVNYEKFEQWARCNITSPLVDWIFGLEQRVSASALMDPAIDDPTPGHLWRMRPPVQRSMSSQERDELKQLLTWGDRVGIHKDSGFELCLELRVAWQSVASTSQFGIVDRAAFLRTFPSAPADLMGRFFENMDKSKREELVSVSPEELSLLSTARTLKSHLSRLYGFPETLQQLLYDGCLLKDADRLPTPADLQLVLQSALHTDAESDELFYAIHHGYTEAVRLLLAAGAFNQLATWQRNKALVEAADHDVDSNRVEIMRSLLRYAHTDDVNFGRGKVPLVQAAQHGQHEMVSPLLQAGADKDPVEISSIGYLVRLGRKG
eukprot:s6386_g1.t1